MGGVRVRLLGLEAKPELNGIKGVLESFNVDKERWAVALEGGKGSKLFKEANLEFAPETEEDARREVALLQARLSACMEADRGWVEEHHLQVQPFPEKLDALELVEWHVDKNLCGGQLEWSQFIKEALAEMIEGKDPVMPLDDPDFDPRVKNFLVAFRDAKPGTGST